jgi:hypothetical protein
MLWPQIDFDAHVRSGKIAHIDGPHKPSIPHSYSFLVSTRQCHICEFGLAIYAHKLVTSMPSEWLFSNTTALAILISGLSGPVGKIIEGVS